MSRYFYQILLVLFLTIGQHSLAQNVANIGNTSVQLKGDKVQITFDILNTHKDAWFLVGVEITDSEGRNINVTAFEGDIGEAQQAGKNKVIMWDPGADSVFLNARIDIQVYANMILPTPPPVEPETEMQVEERKPAEEEVKKIDNYNEITDSPPEKNVAKEFNRTAIILQSVALPGLGLSRVTGKPHWIKGVAGYGCIVGAIVFNKKAVSSYNDYSVADSHDEANALFSTTTKQNNISQGLAFTAIAIWVVDLTWTFVGTKDMKKAKSLSQSKGISIDADYDMNTNTPMLSFKYSF